MLTLDDGSTTIVARIDSESPKKMQGYIDHLLTSRKLNDSLPVDEAHPLVIRATQLGVTDAATKVQAAMANHRSQARVDAVLLTLLLANFKRRIVEGVGVVAEPKFTVEITEASWYDEEADADALMLDLPPAIQRDRTSLVEHMVTAIYAMLEVNPKLSASLVEQMTKLTKFGGAVASDKDAQFPNGGQLEGSVAGSIKPDSGSEAGDVHQPDSTLQESAEAS